ncbi:hypothetical protein AnigIFM56816_000576 [Aspergillus niger]|nr:hypothetical protein CBS11852_6837 [Aspergillus niger]KAI3017987.1 hypothetical protein CBS147347_9924 [Aspergillus niger]GKZ77793.1 hypothetical protein AnigIFM56816_000576 [Aspergillus niger]GKZ98490.1 hypothetical protein AnigIFM59636_003285 [Aspergillus niger]GLA43440.1 hypothetical protein AnigIFM63309_001366 [Aspergillus niger]
MRYQDYLDAYNHPDEGAKARFFTEDCKFQLGELKVEGRDAMLAMFANGHIGVKEELRPLHVLETEGYIFAELDACFMPFEDTPQNFFHPFKRGEPLSFRFFASYEIRDDRISFMRLAHWPAPSVIEPF